MELCAKTINGLKPLNTFAKSSILDVRSCSKYSSDIFHIVLFPNNKNGFLFKFGSCSILIANLQILLMKKKQLSKLLPDYLCNNWQVVYMLPWL